MVLVVPAAPVAPAGHQDPVAQRVPEDITQDNQELRDLRALRALQVRQVVQVWSFFKSHTQGYNATISTYFEKLSL